MAQAAQQLKRVEVETGPKPTMRFLLPFLTELLWDSVVLVAGQFLLDLRSIIWRVNLQRQASG